MRSLFAAALLALAAFALPAFALAADALPPPPTPQPVVEGIWLIPGSFQGECQPDGNTIIFEGASGFVVMDTGRHVWHRAAIIEFARTRKRPITALINSHWHLDHTSGNARCADHRIAQPCDRRHRARHSLCG